MSDATNAQVTESSSHQFVVPMPHGEVAERYRVAYLAALEVAAAALNGLIEAARNDPSDAKMELFGQRLGGALTLSLQHRTRFVNCRECRGEA